MLCAGHRIAPTLIIPYQRAVWLAKLCRTRGPSLILAQAILYGRSTPLRNLRDLLAEHCRHYTIGAGRQPEGGGSGKRQESPNP